MTDERKKEIIKLITKEGEISTGKIANLLGINFYTAETLVSELYDSKEIELVQKKRGNYWKIKEVKKR